jgi:hypothetical protein
MQIHRFENFDPVKEKLMSDLRDFTNKQLKIGKEMLKNVSFIAKREKKETVEAAKILALIVKNGHATEEQIKFLKHQSVDILKILGLLGVSLISMTIPIFLDKILKPKGINIFPKEMSSDVKDI